MWITVYFYKKNYCLFANNVKILNSAIGENKKECNKVKKYIFVHLCLLNFMD